MQLLKKIGDLDLDIDSIRNQAEELYDKLTSLDTKSIFDRVADFFRSILEFFQGLFQWVPGSPGRSSGLKVLRCTTTGKHFGNKLTTRSSPLPASVNVTS